MTVRRFRHHLPFGAEPGADGITRFRLWAPSARAVAVVLRDGAEVAMQPEGQGWFGVETKAPPGTRYRYRVAPDLAVPDPAARAQDGDVMGWSVVTDAEAFAWQHGDWQGRPWHETVLYELHPGSFGGFRGVMAELPRLAQLGITAVELMPVADFAGRRNWGYDGVLPFAPDEAYGTPDDLKALVDAAHGLGLMVFLDVVYNHFGPEGNWLHAYAEPFFAVGTHTPWGAAIDFSKAPVRDVFTQNAILWINEYRFDGLRFDAVHAIESAPGRDVLKEMAQRIRAEVEPGRHVHLVLEHDENAASHLGAGSYDAQWNDDGHHCLHVLLTGEEDGYYADYAEAPAALLARCLSQGFAYQGEASPHRGGVPRGEPSGHLPPTAFVLFLQNHDQIGNRALGERLTALAEPAALDAARALLLLCPQVPMLFMGEEWASRRPFLYFTDYTGDLAKAVREGRLREFSRFAAFAGDAARAAIPDPNAPATFEASRADPLEATQAAHAAALEATRALLALRRTAIMPRLQGAAALAAEAIGAAAVRSAWRMGDGSTLRLLCNLGAEPVAIQPHDTAPLHATPPDAAAAVASGTLPGHATVWCLDGGAAP
ncbi:malto-oligosyltrehalose trehalohydrolase [Roseomonas sp. AR75]|uniref:malto-oligosyltrehalose trehalohydrolase n=1 Tax=Roseomonas sp. AR75 TaxID=2562311 RepID=UPI0010C108B1|nr:malto-oligosyltrehalose trehalohydrolase [Roseomonas sp. AR75]